MNDQQMIKRYFCAWFVVSMFALVLLVSDLYFITNDHDITLVFLIKLITGATGINITPSKFNDGYLLIPGSLYVMMSFIQYMVGKCLAIHYTI